MVEERDLKRASPMVADGVVVVGRSGSAFEDHDVGLGRF